MKKIKRTIAAMTAGLLCLAGTPTLPAEIQRTILLNANAADDVAADENVWYLRNGLNVSVALAPGEQKQLTFKCRKLNENNYYSYSELGYNEISQYVQISSDYDESLIQVDEETGYITAVEGTDGGTTQFTVEDAQGNVQEVNVRVVGRDLEIVGMHVQSDNSYYFLDGSDTQDIDVYLGWNYGELRISYDYYTGYPDYEFVKDTYSPDLCEEVTYDDYYISFDKETGVFRVYGGQSEIVITGSNGFEQKLNVWGYVDATTTRASTTTSTTTSMTTTAAYIPETVTTEEESETTTQALRTETYAAETTTYNEPEPMATTSYYVPETVTTETIRTETYPMETTSYYVYVPETYVTTTAMTYDIAETTRMTTTSYYVPETYETTTSYTTTSSTTTSSTTTSSTTTSSNTKTSKTK
ncbi:MAG: hypothetical protein K2H89_08130 [Oscillospiraceae bacterium]|nr:hypothetical protein [Oscillospiraceae bacterium]